MAIEIEQTSFTKHIRTESFFIVLKLGDREYRYQKSRITIGSISSNDLKLTGEGIGPIHAVIELHELRGRTNVQSDGPIATVYDLASDTGVFVNGKKEVTSPLKAGDRITIGRQELTIRVEKVASITAKDILGEINDESILISNETDLHYMIEDQPKFNRPLFKFSGPERNTIEVVLAANDAVINVLHFDPDFFKKEREVLIGPESFCHFPLFLKGNTGRFPLLTQEGGNFKLSIPQEWEGVVQRDSRVIDVKQIKDQATKSSARFVEVVLRSSDYVKVQNGELSFYICFSAAPPKLLTNRLDDKDPLFLQTFLGSLLFTAVAFYGLMHVRVQNIIETEKLPERIATILYQPEKYQIPRNLNQKIAKAQEQPPEPTVPRVKVEPKPEPTTTIDLSRPRKVESKQAKQAAKVKGQSQSPQEVAQGGMGARAKGKEGTRGTVNAKDTGTPQNVAMRPSAQGGKGMGGAGNSQVKGEGNVDILSGSSEKLLSVLGNSGQNLGRGGERVQGFGGFDTKGKGGQALSGSGTGGGGDAASLGGLADKGRGGGKVGTGLGAEGTGVGIVGGKTRIVLRTGGPEETVVMGAIDSSGIEAAILARREEFRLCYEREINAENSEVHGKVRTSFSIGASGYVTEAGVKDSTLKNANVEGCVIKVLRRIQFPEPLGGGVVQVIYPFTFDPVKR